MRQELMTICLLIVVTVACACTTDTHIDEDKQYCKYNTRRKLKVGESRIYYRRCLECSCTTDGLICCGYGSNSDDLEQREGYEIRKRRRCKYEYVPITPPPQSLVGSTLITPSDDILTGK
ncbi:uncharacterized protein LOC110450020 [Mizuhopecten yessoensis]|uniref:Beta-microseminoprotein n=1 Tax=Mizuhopecten yessoensis TaxID=6573 RepID=A0A210R5L5_MIZYE|nr:uncharacterized protein LOC110450020 [Mizuhopecten yessoensis]OWF56171.1 hypothetical protein KP79_PYT21567 [Mizuhopecten yessoensis]